MARSLTVNAGSFTETAVWQTEGEGEKFSSTKSPVEGWLCPLPTPHVLCLRTSHTGLCLWALHVTSQASWKEALLEESLPFTVKPSHPIYKKPNQTEPTKRLPKNRETKEELKCRNIYVLIYTASSAEMSSNACGTSWNCFSSRRFGSEKFYTDCTIRWSDFCSPNYKINQLCYWRQSHHPCPKYCVVFS